MSMEDIVVMDASRRGRSYSVNSMTIETGRPPLTTSAWYRVPRPMGPSESFSTRRIWALYIGSLRSSATKSNTPSTGRPMTMSPWT
jgi:hypothetical protein